MARWTWPPDKWERLSTVASLVGPAGTVLDVGGRGQELAGLLPASDVTTVNLEEPADVVVRPGPLPFYDSSVDVVTSTDVLEHVPPEDRAPHLAELVRVARRRVVVCFPCGSPEKDAAEQAMARQLTDYGTGFDFLDEHLEHGLPRPSGVREILAAADPAARVTVWLQNGIEERDAVLLDALRARYRRDPRALLRFARAWVRRPQPELTEQQDPTSNRAYVVVDL
jgi:hypothetical protein